MSLRWENLKKNKEVRNAGWLIGGRIIQMLLSLVVGVLTARYLGPGNYGLINYGSAYVAFFTALCNLGLNSIIIKDFVDHPDEQGKAIGSALVMRMVSSVLSALLIIAIVSVIDRDEPLTVVVVALCSLGLVFHIFETFNFWFQNNTNQKSRQLRRCLRISSHLHIKSCCLYLVKMFDGLRSQARLTILRLQSFCGSSYKRYRGAKLQFAWYKCKQLLGASYNYILSSMMVAIYGQTDKLMLKQMLNEEAVGYYSTATAVCSMWTFVLQAIIDSVYPSILRLAKSDTEAYRKKNRQLYAIVFYVSCFVSIGFVLLGEFIIRILYGVA